MNVARGLNRDKLIHIRKFNCIENFVCERQKLVVYAFIEI